MNRQSRESEKQKTEGKDMKLFKKIELALEMYYKSFEHAEKDVVK